MTLKAFINQFSHVFEETDVTKINFDDSYLDLDEWDSMTALAVMAHFDEEFDLKIEPGVLFKCNSFKELYDLLYNK